MKELTFANFYAGLSENRYFGAEKGQFQYAKNVDMQAEPRGMRLIAEQALDIETFNGATGDCTLEQRLEDWFPNASGWLHFIGGVLYLDGAPVAGSPSTGIKGWQKIVIGGNNYVYLFGNTSVDLYAVGTWTYTTAAAALSASSVTFRPSINVQGAVYVGAGDRIISVSGASPVTVSTILSIGAGEDVTGLTRFSAEFKIYTKVGIEGGGKQYTWDGASNSISTYNNWDNCAPIAAVSAWPFDYVLAGKNEEFMDLYIATGNDRKIVRSGAVGGKGRRFFPRMKMCKDIVYIMGSIDITKKGETANRQSCIYSYGSENAGFPNGLQIETVLPTGITTEEQGYNNLYPTEDFLYFTQGFTSLVANKQYKIQKRRDISTDYVTSGEWISNTITGGVIWTLKNFRMLAIAYSLDPTLGYGGTIDVYIRNKSYGDFTLIKTIDDTSVNFCKIYENELDGAINIFNEMEVKLVLNADETGEFSPIVYEGTLVYEDQLKS